MNKPTCAYCVGESTVRQLDGTMTCQMCSPCHDRFTRLEKAHNNTRRLWETDKRELAEAKAKLIAVRETCHWRENEDGCWWSDCKRGYEFTTDGPAANEFAWCPFCGKQCVPIAYNDNRPAGEGEREI